MKYWSIDLNLEDDADWLFEILSKDNIRIDKSEFMIIWDIN